MSKVSFFSWSIEDDGHYSNWYNGFQLVIVEKYKQKSLTETQMLNLAQMRLRSNEPSFLKNGCYGLGFYCHFTYLYSSFIESVEIELSLSKLHHCLGLLMKCPHMTQSQASSSSSLE